MVEKRTVKNIIKDLAAKHNLPINVVEKIVESPWRAMAEDVKKIELGSSDPNDYPMFYHVHFGIFKTNSRRLTRYLTYKKENENATHNQQ